MLTKPSPKAFALIDHVSERERLYISGHYYQWVKRDLDKALDAYQVDARTYPWFAPPHAGLYMVHVGRGEYEKALAEEREALRLEPRNVVFIANLIYIYAYLDRFDEAKAMAVNMLAQRPDQPSLHFGLLYVAYLQDDRATQEKEIQWFAGKPDEYASLTGQAANAMVHGQLRKAKELSQRAVELARRQGVTDQVGPPPAVIDALMGDCGPARKEKSNAALFLCGDASSLRLVEEYAAQNPPRNPDLPPFPYQRGLTALRAGKGVEAEAEFQKILDHKGRNWGPQYPLSYLGLARAAALAGDAFKAKQAYRDFLTLWKRRRRGFHPSDASQQGISELTLAPAYFWFHPAATGRLPPIPLVAHSERTCLRGSVPKSRLAPGDMAAEAKSALTPVERCFTETPKNGVRSPGRYCPLGLG